MEAGETIALIKALSGGGPSLPSVTSSDNGKVLSVENGAWAADENILNVTYANNTLSHTYAEIVAAIDAGKTVTLTNSGKKYFAQYYSTDCVVFSYQSNIAKTINFCKVTNTNTFSVQDWSFVPNPYAGINGSELIVKNGSWVAQQKKFVVTLTPTALDYSGTMDKTVAEINAAYEAGQEIWFNISASGMSVTFPLADANKDVNMQYPSFDAVIWNSIDGVVIHIATEFTDDGTKDTYGTDIYSLTPAS